MRLTSDEVAAIKAATHEAFGGDAIVRLFGSRVRDDLKGGDVDLHVETDLKNEDVQHRATFFAALFRQIEERKVDLVVHPRSTPVRPIDQVAYQEGLVL